MFNLAIINIKKKHFFIFYILLLLLTNVQVSSGNLTHKASVGRSKSVLNKANSTRNYLLNTEQQDKICSYSEFVLLCCEWYILNFNLKDIKCYKVHYRLHRNKLKIFIRSALIHVNIVPKVYWPTLNENALQSSYFPFFMF